MPLTDEEIQRLAENLRDPKYNGERMESRAQRKPRFDGTINLGHVLTILSIVLAVGPALATMWVKSEVTRDRHERRIVALEETVKEVRQLQAEQARAHTEAMAKMSETQAQGMRNQDKISVALEYLTKGNKP